MVKRYSIPNAFNPTTGAVDCSNIGGFVPGLLLAVLNTTAPGRPVIYDVVTPGAGFAQPAIGSTIYLESDTVGQSSGDSLIVIWDDGLAGGGGGGGGGALSAGWNNGVVIVTGSPVAMPNFAPTNGVEITARETNAAPVQYGFSSANLTTGQGLNLNPGMSKSLSLLNLNLIYVMGTPGDFVEWTGT